MWKKQKRNHDIRKSMRRKRIRNERGLLCVSCDISLPIDSHKDRMYCDSCLIIQKKKRRKLYYLNSKIKPLTIN